MNNKTNIEEDMKILRNMIEKDFSNPDGWSGYYDSELKKLQQAIENILAYIERLIEKLNKKDKTIETMRCIKNTSRYEDTILIDEDKVNCTRRNKFLIELNNGEFIEVNALKAKANKYDSLVEKFNKLKKEYKETENSNSIKAFILKCQIEILQELLGKE